MSAFLDGKIDKIVALEPDLVIGFSDMQAALADKERSSAPLEQARAAAEGRAAQLEAELRQARAAPGDSTAQSAASAPAAQAAAQLAAVHAGTAALKQSLEAAVARADGHYNAIQQMNAQVQVSATSSSVTCSEDYASQGAH